MSTRLRMRVAAAALAALFLPWGIAAEEAPPLRVLQSDFGPAGRAELWAEAYASHELRRGALEDDTEESTATERARALLEAARTLEPIRLAAR